MLLICVVFNILNGNILPSFKTSLAVNLLDCDIEIFYIGNIEMIIVHDGFATIDPATLVQQDKLSEMVAN